MDKKKLENFIKKVQQSAQKELKAKAVIDTKETSTANSEPIVEKQALSTTGNSIPIGAAQRYFTIESVNGVPFPNEVGVGLGLNDEMVVRFDYDKLLSDNPIRTVESCSLVFVGRTRVINAGYSIYSALTGQLFRTYRDTAERYEVPVSELYKATGSADFIFKANWECQESFLLYLVELQLTYTQDSPSLDRLEITKQPTKQVYSVGDSFSTEGMVVKAIYSNNASHEVSDYTYSPKGQLSRSNTYITITYKGVSTKVYIAVRESSSDDLVYTLSAHRRSKTTDMYGHKLWGLWSSEILQGTYNIYRNESTQCKLVVSIDLSSISGKFTGKKGLYLLLPLASGETREYTDCHVVVNGRICRIRQRISNLRYTNAYVYAGEIEANSTGTYEVNILPLDGIACISIEGKIKYVLEDILPQEHDSMDIEYPLTDSVNAKLNAVSGSIELSFQDVIRNSDIMGLGLSHHITGETVVKGLGSFVGLNIFERLFKEVYDINSLSSVAVLLDGYGKFHKLNYMFALSSDKNACVDKADESKIEIDKYGFMSYNGYPVYLRQMTDDGYEYLSNGVPDSVEKIDYYNQIKDSGDDNLIPTDWLVSTSIVKGYNKDGYLVMISDQFKNFYFIRYENGYIKQVIDNKGNTYDFIYNSQNLLESITNSKGQIEKFNYGEFGWISNVSFYNADSAEPYKQIEFSVAMEGGNGFTQGTTFNVVEVVEAEKKCNLEYDYRVRRISNRTLVNKIPDGEAIETVYATTEFAYDTVNFITTITDERHDEEIYRYNQEGKKTEYYRVVNDLVVGAIKYTYAEGETSMLDTIEKCDKEVLNKSELSSFVFKCGEKKIIYYNYLKQIIQESISEVNISDDTTYSSSVNYYRSTTNNNILSTETSENYSTEGVTTYIYRIQEQYFYGENNNLIKKVKHFSSRNDSNPVLGFEPDYCEVEEYAYNDMGLITETKKYRMNWNGHDDGQCNCSAEADTDIFRTEKTYLDNGLVHKEKDETCLHDTEYEYEGNTKLVSKITKANGGKYFYTYDHEDRVKALSSTVDGLENSNHTQYQSGEVIHLYADATDKKPSIRYEYDGKLRLSKIIYNDNTYATFSYEEGVSYVSEIAHDSKVDTVEMVNANNETFKTISDRSGRFVEIYYNTSLWAAEEYNADGTPFRYYDYLNSYFTGFNYDTVGNVTRCLTNYTYDKNINALMSYEQNYEYGVRGDVSQIVESGVVNRIKTFLYENTSSRRLKGMHCGNNSVFYNYDISNRYVGKRAEYNLRPVYTQKIIYRKEGNVATNIPAELQFLNRDNIADARLTYTYDENNNISTIKNNTVLQAKYEYDALDRLVREDNLAFGKSYFFVYDDNGNILSKETADYQSGAYVQGTSDDIVQYLYSGDKLVSYNGQTIVYDSMGNPTTYRGKTLVWAQSKNLVSYDGITCAYNYKKLRIRKGNDYYIYDSQDRLIYIRRRFNEDNDISFMYDDVGLLGFSYRNADYIYKTDIQGNIIAIVDNNGNTVVEYYYDAWGNYAINDTSNIGLGEINPFRYRGYFYDTDMGLYYLKTRYYDPEVGRFINMDGISYADPESINGLNLYAYCGNNPVMNVDPEGHAWWQWVIAAVIVVVAVAVSVATVGVASTIVAGAIGAAVGVGTELAADVIDDGQINRGVDDYIGSAVGGFVAGLGGNIISSSLFGGTGDLVSGLISSEIDDIGSAFHAFGSSAISSGILALGSNAFARGIAKNKYNKIIGNSTSNIKINKKLKNAGYGYLKIGRDGLETVLYKISQSKSCKIVNGIVSNTTGFVVGLLREVF